MILLIALLSHLFILQTSEYSIEFSRVDNRATVHINDSLVYNTGTIDGNPELSLKVNLTDFMKTGVNYIRVDVYNGSGADFDSFDENWEVYYEIFKNQDPIDFFTEKSSNGTAGLVSSMTYEVVVN